MVAISLYRGNLHKVPDVPRRWVGPAPTISLKDFRILLRRRARALARLSSTNANPNPNPGSFTESDSGSDDERNGISDSDCKPEVAKVKEEEEELPEAKAGEVENGKKSDGGDSSEKLAGEFDAMVEVKQEAVVEDEVNALVKEVDAAPRVLQQAAEEEEEKVVVKAEGGDVNPSSEMDKKEDVLSDKEKRRREIEDKLQILNEKKHSLVQVLKQILSAEEELKRRSSMQGMAVRPPVALHVDTTHDPGSGSRLNTPRMGSDGNVNNEAEGGETYDINHNVHSRQLLRMSSTSPSSDSQQRKSAFNAVPLPSRANSGVAISPSRFALTGQQGRPSNLPSVSVSGTNYVASSPSPAASGASSALRDGRIPSPWN